MIHLAAPPTEEKAAAPSPLTIMEAGPVGYLNEVMPKTGVIGHHIWPVPIEDKPELLGIITTKGRRREGTDSIERMLWLPVSPELLARQLRHLLPEQRINSTSVQKLCLLISECYQLTKKQQLGPRRFRISNKTVKPIASAIGGRRPLAILDALGITRQVGTHRSDINPHPITREFCSENFQKHKVLLTGIAARESYHSGKRTQQRHKKEPVFLWIESSLERVTLSAQDQALWEQKPKQGGNPEKFGAGRRPQNWKATWNIVCQIPAQYRCKLLFDQTAPAALLDLSASFPTMLPWLLEDYAKHLGAKGLLSPEDTQSYAAENGRLRAALSNEDFYLYLDSEATRDETKHAFQRFLNSKKPDPPAAKIGARFRELFPLTSAMIISRRTQGTLFGELQGRQKEIIFAAILKCHQAGIPCVPVWDELVVPYPHEAAVREMMHDEIFKRTGVRAKVGGVRMEAASKNTTPTPEGHCPECWAERKAIRLGSPFPCAHQPLIPALFIGRFNA